MLECFENLVGAKSCNDIGYKNYIENLNISVKKLAGIANGSQISGQDYLKAKVEEAVELTLATVSSNISPVVEQVANIQYESTYQEYKAEERGVIYRSKCNLERLFIDFVLFKANDTVNGKTLKIIDGDNQILIPFNTVAGMVVSIPVNAKFNNSEVQILVDNSDVRPAKNKFFTQDCLCLNAGQTYGISIIGYYQCDEDLLKCQLSNIDAFGKSVLYKTGALIIEDLNYSTQLNEVVITKAQNLNELADTYHHRSEIFAKSAKKSFDKLVRNSCCYDCEETTMYNFKM
jgi:hypothetical protein